MTDMPMEVTAKPMQEHGHSPDVALRSLVIGLTAFLTVVDLFATQAILPTLTRHYGVTPGAMGFAVNASTIGMAVAGLVVGSFSPHIDRRTGILASLLLLAIPTSLLAVAPNLAVFTILRIMQGLCMASAFTLTLAYLGEQCSAMDAGGAFAAYITGNVASNLIGRLISASVSDNLGLATNFYFFAVLNLAGALLVYFTIKRVQPMHSIGPAQSPLSAMIEHWRDPALRAAFGLGFCILFAFIGTFTYVNFILVRAPLSLGMMGVGFVYFVFLPSVVTTLLAGKAVALFGMRLSLWGGLAIAALGLPLMLSSHLADVLAGMVLIGVGTFFAQACATGFVGQAARTNRGVASGTYLACYFFGGLVGSAVLGQLFDHFGWVACVAGVGVALTLGCILTASLRIPVSGR
ncbi:MFS transporter [Bradyrhizobium australafricanum]|uniref:MFS transporter n=1 Tax=Bradyrhizobium australafricanum TaxID=2821406 RepID=UPI001CE31F67|nr:MFS transporter [Bradyrhizobium australafricanum]MCA6100453.1 MFS transporter [Bradyrhizobium australafricanum]